MIPKRNETNGSITLTEVHDGAGCPRQLNIHGYKVGSCNSPRLSLAILDHEGKLCGSVILDPDHVRELLGQITEMM